MHLRHRAVGILFFWVFAHDALVAGAIRVQKPTDIPAAARHERSGPFAPGDFIKGIRVSWGGDAFDKGMHAADKNGTSGGQIGMGADRYLEEVQTIANLTQGAFSEFHRLMPGVLAWIRATSALDLSGKNDYEVLTLTPSSWDGVPAQDGSHVLNFRKTIFGWMKMVHLEHFNYPWETPNVVKLDVGEWHPQVYDQFLMDTNAYWFKNNEDGSQVKDHHVRTPSPFKKEKTLTTNPHLLPNSGVARVEQIRVLEPALNSTLPLTRQNLDTFPLDKIFPPGVVQVSRHKGFMSGELPKGLQKHMGHLSTTYITMAGPYYSVNVVETTDEHGNPLLGRLYASVYDRATNKGLGLPTPY